MKTTVIRRCKSSYPKQDLFNSEGSYPNDGSAAIRQFARFMEQKGDRLEKEYRNLQEGLGQKGDHSSSMLDRRQLVKALTQILDEMSPQEKTLLSLYYCEELNFKEIGEVLGYRELKVIELFRDGIKKVAAKMQLKADN
jgi:RNA polymerase sigma factor (sigma-70 family)